MEDEADAEEVDVVEVFVRDGSAGVESVLEPLHMRGDVGVAWEVALVDACAVDVETGVGEVGVDGDVGVCERGSRWLWWWLFMGGVSAGSSEGWKDWSGGSFDGHHSQSCVLLDRR